MINLPTNTGIERNEQIIIEKLARKVASLGGRAYFVGGIVRDRMMGRISKDVDIEIHGISEEVLILILKEIGKPLSFGSSFGIYSLAGHNIDIALPRSERKSGKGHREFEIKVNPFIGIREAARRRDFTINAMMQDVLTGEIHDPFGGADDIKNKIIRYIDKKKFQEDPLRAMRAAQFAARFGFKIEPSTIRLCAAQNLTTLSSERVEAEMKKALLTAECPSIFFENLRAMSQLGYWFPEIKFLIGLEQNKAFHPEGDVFNHTMQVLDRAAAYRNKVSEPYSFMLLALTHDFGKTTTTEFINGAIHAYGHEFAGVEIADAFLSRICHINDSKKYVRSMIPHHMRPNIIAENRSSLKKTNKLFDSVPAPLDLIYFAMADKPENPEDNSAQNRASFLFERYEMYKKVMEAPHVTGRDLILNGIKPSSDFSEILAYAHKLRLAGIKKESALKQTLSYARNLNA